MALTLAQLSQGRDNNLNLLRALAAVLVIVTHAHGLTGVKEPLVPLLGVSFGSLAVDLFFIVSGLLIAKSWQRRAHLTTFIYARIMRIYPGLWLSLAFTLLIIGPSFTSLSLGAFFSHFETLKYLLENSTLILNGIATHLPATFDGQGSGSTNVSLWTLPFELKMYLLLALLGVSGLFDRRWPVLMLTLAAALEYGGAMLGLGWPAVLGAYARFIFFFFVGSCCYLWRDRLLFSHRRAVLLLIFSLPLLWWLPLPAQRHLLLALILPWLVFYLAYLPGGWLRHYNRLGDYSYGLYIYAFPVQQAVLALAGGSMSPLANFTASLLLTLLLAALSWHLLEERVLRIAPPAWLLRGEERVRASARRWLGRA